MCLFSPISLRGAFALNAPPPPDPAVQRVVTAAVTDVDYRPLPSAIESIPPLTGDRTSIIFIAAV